MKKKQIALTSALVVAGAALGYTTVSKKIFDETLVRGKKSIADDSTNYQDIDELNEKAYIWLQNTKHQEVNLKANDGILLHAYKIIQEDSHDWVILIHGYKAKAKDMMYSAMMYYKQGYNVLVINHRSHGKSEGKYIGMGWLERLDICDWISYIMQLDANSKIVIHGVSMGGATVMMTTGEKLPSNVICAIEDCGYTSANDIFINQASKKYDIHPVILMTGFNAICKYKAKYSLKEADSLAQLRKSTTPTLFIHGDDDAFVPVEMVYHNYENCPVDKELFIAKGKGHALACLDSQYYTTVFNFIEKYK